MAVQPPNTMIHDPSKVYQFNSLLLFLARKRRHLEKISAKKFLDKTCIPA
jgi:hypothetical protein